MADGNCLHQPRYGLADAVPPGCSGAPLEGQTQSACAACGRPEDALAHEAQQAAGGWQDEVRSLVAETLHSADAISRLGLGGRRAGRSPQHSL